MFKKTVTFTDYNDNVRTEDFYFHLNKAELTEMELSYDGGLIRTINQIVATQDNKKIVEIFKNLVLSAYGEKSLDGRRFIKNQEIRDNFAQTEAYSQIFMELAENADKAAEFVNGIVPSIPSNK